MKLLLDTCTFLWVAADSPELSARARSLFADPENEVWLSFDRILVCQAIANSLAILTPDARITQYPVRTEW